MRKLNESTLVEVDSPKGIKAVEIFRSEYRKAKLTEERAHDLIENPEFASYLLRGIKRFSKPKKIPEYKLASQILGEDFIPPQDIMRLYLDKKRGLSYSNRQLGNFKKTIPSKKTLVWCRENNFMLIAGPSVQLSLIEVNNLNLLQNYSMGNKWISKEPFARNEKVKTKWYMIRKDLVPGSIFKKWSEQLPLLSKKETVPSSVELAWAILIYRKITGISLFWDLSAFTSSISTDKSRVSVGFLDLYFDLFLNIDKNKDGISYLRDYGLASSRK